MNSKLLKFLERVYGVSKHTYKSNYAFFSPFVSHRKPKLEINLEPDHEGNHTWHCWVSDKGGKTISSLLRATNKGNTVFSELNKILEVSDREVSKKRILQYSGSNIVDPEDDEEIVTLPEGYKPLIGKLSYEGKNAVRYLAKRGLTAHDIKSFKIGYCETGEYKQRIVIPSYTDDGKLNYFVTRKYYEGESKYKNADTSKDIIYFEYRINWNLPLVLCEGPFDALAIKHNVVPLLGKTINQTLKKNILRKLNNKLYICLDDDAINNAYEIAKTFFDEGIEVYVTKLKTEDASDLGYEKVWEHITNAEPFNFYNMVAHQLRNV